MIAYRNNTKLIVTCINCTCTTILYAVIETGPQVLCYQN
jgi:hypothetical protein